MLLLCILGPLQTSSNFLVSACMCMRATPKQGLKCSCRLDLIWKQNGRPTLVFLEWSDVKWLTTPPSLNLLCVRKQSRQLPFDFKDLCAGISDVNGSWKRAFAKNHGGINPCFLEGAWKHCGNYIVYRDICCWVDPFILWCILKTKKFSAFLYPLHILELELGIWNTFFFIHSAWLRSLCSPLTRMWARLSGPSQAARELHSECLNDTGCLCVAQPEKTIPTTNNR